MNMDHVPSTALDLGTRKVPGKALVCRGEAQGFLQNIRQGGMQQRSAAWGAGQLAGTEDAPRAHGALSLG